MPPVTLQPATRPKATAGAASSTEAYTGFVTNLRTKLREDASFHTMAADPVMRPKMLNTVRNSLIGAVPDFQRLNETDQMQFTERALNEALQPTTGERVQHTIEDIAPVIPPSVAAATGAGIPLTAAAAAGGALIPEVTRPFTTGEPPDFLGGIRRAATNGALTAVGEKIIRPIGAAIGKFRQNQVLGEGPQLEQTKAARSVLEPGLRDKGFFLTPKQLSREHLPPVTEFIENVAESGLGGRGVLQAQRRATDDTIADAAVALQQNLQKGLATNEEAATMFLNHAHGRELYLRTISSLKHRVVDDLNKQGVTVPAKPVIDIVGLRNDPTTKAVLSNFKVPELRDQRGKLLRPGYTGADGFYEMLNGAGPRQVSFGDADRARSALLEISRDFGGPTASGGDKQVAKLAGNMAERLRTGMDVSARKLDPKAADAYASAKEFHRTQVIDQFDDAVYKGIIKSIEKEPGKFAQYALSPENVDKLKVLKQMAGDGELGAWPEIQGRLLQHIVSRSVEKESLGLGLELNQVVEQGLLRKISGDSIRSSVKALGPEGEKLLLGGPAGEAFRKFTNALEVGAARPEGPGKIGTILMQFGAVTTLAGGLVGGIVSGGDWAAITGGAGAGATAVLLTPRAFAKIMTNEKLMRNIADGVIGGPKSVAFGRMATNIGLLNDDIQRSVGGSLHDVIASSTAPRAGLVPGGQSLTPAPPGMPPAQ